MAKQKGVIKYVGTIGDIRHFRMKGSKDYLAGMKGGPSGEQVKNAPEFARTRENMSEFAGSATCAKSIRMGFSQLLKTMSDSRLTGRMTGIVHKILKEDTTNSRGQRSIMITDNTDKLTGIEFNKNINFSNIFNTGYTLDVQNKQQAMLTVPVFFPKNYINYPEGATHFRLINAMSTVSNFEFNQESRAYEPIDGANNSIPVIEYSDYIDLNTELNQDLQLMAQYNQGYASNNDISVISAIGIEFYQQVNNDYYLLASGNALKVDGVY